MMQKRVVAWLWVLALLCALPLFAQESLPVIRQINAEQWQQLRDEVQAKPGMQRFEEQTSTRLEVKDELSIYWFTSPEHPAHPAVVKRELLKKEERFDVISTGWAGGSREKFEEWFIGFLEQDQRIRDKIDGREQPQ